MNVLILGSGGREHAIFLKVNESPLVKNLYIAPGNAGITTENKISLDITNFQEIEETIRKREIALIIVGPEVPLVLGIKDYFQSKMPNVKIFGPDQYAAKLEGSKVFSDDFMKSANIPAPVAYSADNIKDALEIINNHSLPVVVKADGLAAGKGVSIHHDKTEAIDKVKEIFNDKIFGEAGNLVLFQEFLEGEESSLFALCNGKEALILPTARDYKAAYDGGKGPNTGGMGAYCPGDALSAEHIEFAYQNVIKPVLDKFKYTGILYAGLMVKRDNVKSTKVLEFNCRFGDPETQSILPMIEGDIVPYILWSCGDESQIVPKIKENGYYRLPQKTGSALNVVLASNGYPESYEKGVIIELPENMPENLHVVHAGTANKDGKIVSNGGRVMNIVGYAKNLSDTKKLVYNFIETLNKSDKIKGFFYRKDIGNL